MEKTVFACNVIFLGSLPPSKSYFLPHLLLASFLFPPPPAMHWHLCCARQMGCAGLLCLLQCSCSPKGKYTYTTVSQQLLRFFSFSFAIYSNICNIYPICVYLIYIHTSYEISIESAILFKKNIFPLLNAHDLKNYIILL